MSLYRRKGTQFWWIGFRHKGKRLQFSTGTADKEEARQLELAVARRLRGLPRERFIAMVDAVVGDEAGRPTNKVMLVANLTETWMNTLQSEGNAISKREHQTRRCNCTRFVSWCEEHYRTALFIDSVTSEMAWAFVTDCGGTAKTRQNICGSLSSVWACLIRRGLVKENPWHYARPRKDASEEKSGRAFTLEEVRAILRESERYAWMKPAVMVALYTGLRKGDVFSLRWADVDMEHDVIHFTPSKTERHGIRLSIPLHPALKTYLLSLPRTAQSIVGHVPKAHATEWKTVVRTAIGEDKSGALMTFHNLRHTYATWVREAGADKGEVMKLCGHTNIDTSNKYDHADGRLRAVVGRLPSV